MQLKGKTAIVTGGGRGIGRGIVDRFLEEGARVAVVQRSGLDDALRGRPDVLCIEADLTDTAAYPSMAERIHRHFGRIDVLVNNAGLMFERTLEETSEADWELMAALNLKAPLFLAKAALPYLRLQGGSIINIGSIEGIGSNPHHTAYSATKAGLHGMTRALAVDLGKDNIRCNAIAPGWIATDLSEAYLDSMPDPARARQELASIHPIGRVGRNTDIGDVAVFLAGDHAGFMTGEILVVDGGRTAKLSLPG